MKTLTDGPADAVDLAPGAVDFGWHVNVINPDPNHYTLRLRYGHPGDGVTIVAAWFGDELTAGSITRGTKTRPERSIDTIRRAVEDEARNG